MASGILTDPALVLELRSIQADVFLAALVLVPVFEWLIPGDQRPGLGQFLRHTGRNLGLWTLGIVISSVLLSGLLVMLMYALEVNKIGVLYFLGDTTVLSAILGFLVLDFGDYLFHRVSHQVRWLWILHAVHHSDPAVDFSTSLRTHPLHLLLTFGWKLVMVAAFGIPIWLLMVRELVAIPVNVFHHGGFRFPAALDHALRWLIVTPGMHRLHHSPRKEETDSNYATLLSVWDRLFATYREKGISESPQFGLFALSDDRWLTVWGMLITPWRVRNIPQL